MELRHLLLATLLATPTCVLADTTICKVAGDSVDPQVVSWDSVSRKARIKYWSGVTYDGMLTLTRKHDDGTKVNLSFAPTDSIFGDEYEFIVFTIPGAGHRMVGASFIYSGGVKRLSSVLGNFEATCSTL